MSIIKENISASLQHLHNNDVKFIRISQYDLGYSGDILRLNVSLKFVENSIYTKLHNHTGFFNLVFRPTQNLRVLTNPCQGPDWSGYTDMREWCQNEKSQPETVSVYAAKGRIVNAKGNRRTPKLAYYTTLGLSYQLWGKDQEVCSWVNVQIGDFKIDMEMRETVNTNKMFRFFGQEEIYHV